jgi:raffinose/stachyose/melibiose transport system substrate-binding protein
MIRSLRIRRVALAVAAGATLSIGLAACGSSSSSTTTDGGGGDASEISIAMGSTGDDVDAVFTNLKKEYEATYPGRKINIIVQENDTYETGIGLQTLLASNNPPDIYFERPGARLSERIDEGNAADISTAVAEPRFADRFEAGAYTGMVFDGKTYMVPWTGDVTNVFWYNEDTFKKNSITAPTSWDEFMTACKTLTAAGESALVEGNKDKWTVGSIASHLAARVVGDDAYVAAVTGQAPMNSPEMVTAFGHLQELWDNGCINRDVNAMGDEEANTKFLLGKAAMLGIGSWLVPEQLEQAKDLKMSFFNLPQIPGGAGNPDSVLGVSTGFVVNAKSQHQSDALDFLALMVNPDSTQQFAKSGVTPLERDPFAGVDADPNTIAMADMLSKAPVTITPADNLDVKRADEFYGAAAAVIGGLKSPQEALDNAQDRVASLPTD